MELAVPFEPELAAAHTRLDVPQQVFIGSDRAARRAGRPFDVERTLGFDTSELVDGPVFSNKVAVATDAGPMASAQGKGREGQKFRRQERPDRDRAHTNCL